MKKLQHTFLEIEGHAVPAKIYEEYRNNVRCSIGKTAAILRLPIQMNKKQKKTKYGWFVRWVKNQFAKNESLRMRFFPRIYKTGDVLEVSKRTYMLKVTYHDRKTLGVSLKNGIIHLKLNNTSSPQALNKGIKQLLSRVIAHDYQDEIEKKVDRINDEYFQKEIHSVNIKYNVSNWGSCSNKGNINLSSRLLFAPDEVIDYVIIHELTHLIEMNHSAKFWKIVQSVMPDYKEKEKWLKVNGGKCDF